MYLSFLLLATFTSSFIPDCLASTYSQLGPATFSGQCKDFGKVSVFVINGLFVSLFIKGWRRIKCNSCLGMFSKQYKNLYRHDWRLQMWWNIDNHIFCVHFQ